MRDPAVFLALPCESRTVIINFKILLRHETVKFKSELHTLQNVCEVPGKINGK